MTACLASFEPDLQAAEGVQAKHQRPAYPEREPVTGDALLRLRGEALLRDDGLAKFMEYQRSRMRIARAVLVNLLLLLPIGIWFFTSSLRVSAGLIASFAIVVLIGIVVSGRAAERLRVAYDSYLKQLPISGSVAPFRRIRVAAVCVQRVSTGEERFLVVRTKQSALTPERWTFPKGHVEAGKSLCEVAMREAREDVGEDVDAEKIVYSDRLPPYLFPAGASSDALVVIPLLFLIKTTEYAESMEPGRKMLFSPEPDRKTCWFPREEAKKYLRLNREDPFTNEHDQVIDRAIDLFRSRVQDMDPSRGTYPGDPLRSHNC